MLKIILCQKYCALYKSTGACFHYEIKECNGACIKEESVEDYNLRVNQAIKSMAYRFQNFLVVDKGRELNERSIIHVCNGSYQGFGAGAMKDYSQQFANTFETLIDPRTGRPFGQ